MSLLKLAYTCILLIIRFLFVLIEFKDELICLARFFRNVSVDKSNIIFKTKTQ